MPTKELVMYSRSSFFCSYVRLAERVLAEYQIPYRVIDIDTDTAARQRVLDWTGFLSVPTLVIAEAGEDQPYEEPSPLAKGASPRGIDRGPMLTEASQEQLEAWLIKHGLLTR